MNKIFNPILLGLLAILAVAAGGEAPPARGSGETDGAATIIHRADVLRDRGASGKHLWPLYSSAEARLNYFEVTRRSALHFHPDGDHRLYVLEGSVVVNAGTNTTIATVGDFIVIPRGVRHSYDVPAKGDRALLLTFDAPPYDPRKTVNLEEKTADK
ncbi:MAG TPA: cupin domain-containing protein [Candidatus Angelobacter sp.]|nr:cupin domain-containing protein [Candidatus Angelobacter sp.]